MANLPVRDVNNVQMVIRMVLHVLLRMSMVLLRLMVNRISLAIFGVLLIGGAIFAALRLAPPAQTVAGQVQQRAMEELTVQFSTLPMPLAIPMLHVTSYNIQWRSMGAGESWTTEGDISIAGVTEGTEEVAYTVRGLDPDRVYRFRVQGKNVLGAGPWSDWFPSNGLVPGPEATPTPEPTATPTPTPTPQTATNVVRFTTNRQPIVGEQITAQLTISQESISNVGTWQWESSMDALTNWESVNDIAPADTSRYTPVVTDVGKFLRAYVTYTDNNGIYKRGLSVIIGPVEGTTE